MKSAHYVCRMGKKEIVARIGQISDEEVERRGLIKARRPGHVNRNWENIPVWVEPACDGLETDDPETFVAHMRDAHGKKPLFGITEHWLKQLRKGGGMWVGPKPKAEGTPVKVRKEDAERVETCGRCGLVAEVDERVANVLWWAEHLERCAGAEEAVA